MVRAKNGILWGIKTNSLILCTFYTLSFTNFNFHDIVTNLYSINIIKVQVRE